MEKAYFQLLMDSSTKVNFLMKNHKENVKSSHRLGIAT